jgi:NitT/TauT family transport system ATP-binding protein
MNTQSQPASSPPLAAPSAASSTANGIQIANLTFVHRSEHEVTVFDRFAAHFRANEISVILGRSACGKTTLLKLICGLLPHDQDSGAKILIDGKTPTLAQKSRILGYLPQDSNPAPWLTTHQNLTMMLRLAEVTGNHATMADSLLSALGLAEMSTRYPDKFSGGQRRKLAMAMTMVTSPSFIFLDEPFSSIDSIGKLELYTFLFTLWETLLASANGKPHGIIIVTHDIHEASLLGDRLFVLHDMPLKKPLEIENKARSYRNKPDLTQWWFTSEHKTVADQIKQALQKK